MKKTVLVVDDEEDICQGIKDFFERKNLTVFTATRGKAACEIANQEQPSVVLLDIRLPDQDGIQCLSEIKMSCPGAMVIMLTAVHDEQVARLALEHGAIDYVTKPFDMENLYDRWVGPLFL